MSTKVNPRASTRWDQGYGSREYDNDVKVAVFTKLSTAERILAQAMLNGHCVELVVLFDFEDGEVLYGFMRARTNAEMSGRRARSRLRSHRGGYRKIVKYDH